MSDKVRVEITVRVFPWDTDRKEGGPEKATLIFDTEEPDTQEKLVAEAARQVFLIAKGATRRKSHHG